MKTLTTLTVLDALKARLELPAAAAPRAQPIAERLRALRTQQTTLEERERELRLRLQLAELERDRTATDIRMGEAWELAIAASRGYYTRLRREEDWLAKERVATERAIVALEGRLPAVRRAGEAAAPAESRCGDLPATAGLPAPRPLEAMHEHGRGADQRPLPAMAASAPEGASRRRGD